MPGMVHRAYLRWLVTQGATSRDQSFEAAQDPEYPGWLFGVKDLHARRAPGNTCLAVLKSAGMGTMEKPKNVIKAGGVALGDAMEMGETAEGRFASLF